MKASVKLREEERKPPLLRAKIPVSVLGLPLIAGATAGDPADLSVHLRTALPSGGPSFKLTYSPTPIPSSPSPFSLSLKSGVGPWGSPDRSPLLISAHLSLGANNTNPSFTIHLKPQIGDFTLRKSAASSNPNPNPKENGGGVYHPIPLSPPPPPPPPSRNGFEGLISSGTTVSATTTMPVARRAAVKLRWGVNFSEAAVSAWRRMPYLTVEKISIEAVEAGDVKKVETTKEGSGGDLEATLGTGFWMRKEVEELRRENGLIKESIEQVRKMISHGKGGVEKEERKQAGASVDAGTRTRASSNTTSGTTRSSP